MSHIFISHATADDAFVKELREGLEAHGLSVWVDSRNLRGGAKLAAEIELAIETARQVIVVLSPQTVNSPWVRREIRKAQEVEGRRSADGYRVIPLLLPGIGPSALEVWFDEEPVAVSVQLGPGELNAALPAILAALGERLPTDPQPAQQVAAQPVEELLLELSDLTIKTKGGTRRATATATLRYQPADSHTRDVESRRFTFTAPLGPIEAGELRWYLEEYFRWPVGEFQKRAARIEAELPLWGRALYDALAMHVAQEALNAWRVAPGPERRFSVLVDSDMPEGTSEKKQAVAREAASTLLSLPWELLYDERGYLFQGAHAARVRRRLPNRRRLDISITGLPIRILLVSPRPEDKRAAYLDHRGSALPLVEAVEGLGDLAELTILAPPTFAALEKALAEARKGGKSFDVVHFDGHGVYDREHGLGALCFEDPKDSTKLAERGMELIDAAKLASMMRDQRIPLVVLDACQTAQAEDDPTASVAGRLLEEGVASVVAMSHSVLTPTAKLFVTAFYGALAHGARVGAAMLAGQRALFGNTFRGKMMGAGELRLQDWFVPVLYQEEQDPQLITRLPPEQVQLMEAQRRRLSLGALPDPPPHRFGGRSRELLALERLLIREQYAVLRGQGGAGKTTLAVELARWLVRTNRFKRVAFVSLETHADARAALDSLGLQLLPDGERWSVAQFPDLKTALQPVERALADLPTLMVFDNMESVLPDANGQPLPGTAPIRELFDLCGALLRASPRTRLLFTSRELLPAPFNAPRQAVTLGALSRGDAVELVGRVLEQAGLAPNPTDSGDTPEEIDALVDAVNRHARALVLLAPEVSSKGVRATAANLGTIMADLDRKHPGERENSLYASVELSLRRLPSEVREQIKALGVVHGGAHLYVISQVLDVNSDATRATAIALIDVGLGEDMGYGYLRLDPALPPYLLSELDAVAADEALARWGEGIQVLVGFLYEQAFKDTQTAFSLTLLELPNLLALLQWAADALSPEEVVSLASSMEVLLAPLGRPQALAQVVVAREAAAQALGAPSNARFLAESANIDRLLERGDVQTAYATAQQLLQCCLDAGEAAYSSAAYDIAMAYIRIGRVLKTGGAAEVALQPLAEARRRFELLAEAGHTNAERMASAAITESAACLIYLGRLDEAAAAYNEAIKLDDEQNRRRDVAVGKAQLGTVRMLQRRYADALAAYMEARNTFEVLSEPHTVATIWHQIGMVHRQASQFEQAERAYRQSLAISVQQNELAKQAATLGELGSLYDSMGRLEEAVPFYQHAADMNVRLQDTINEGRARYNLAGTLLKMRRYDEARRELRRAIECDEYYGHAAESWKTWMTLHDLEQAVGNREAAARARERAVVLYLAYRRDGGENQNPGAKLCALVGQVIREGDIAEAEQYLAQYMIQVSQSWAQMLIPKLQAILGGSRDPALADDPALDFDDAVEVRLLLDGLGGE